MDEEKPKIEGYAIEWEVVPSIDKYAGGISHIEEEIEFSFDGKNITAVIRDTYLDLEEFHQKAESIAYREYVWPTIIARDKKHTLRKLRYKILRDGRWVGLLYHKTKVAINSSIRVIVSDKDGNVTHDTDNDDRILEQAIKELSKKDATLSRALSYFSLALVELDQLTIAGNLYMAMEEVAVGLIRRGKANNWGDVWITLAKSRLALSKTDEEWRGEIEKVGEMLQHGRHAWFKPHKGLNKDKWIESVEIPPHEMKFCRNLIRQLILAYVEWLKQNR